MGIEGRITKGALLYSIVYCFFMILSFPDVGIRKLVYIKVAKSIVHSRCQHDIAIITCQQLMFICFLTMQKY